MSERPDLDDCATCGHVRAMHLDAEPWPCLMELGRDVCECPSFQQAPPVSVEGEHVPQLPVSMLATGTDDALLGVDLGPPHVEIRTPAPALAVVNTVGVLCPGLPGTTRATCDRQLSRHRTQCEACASLAYYHAHRAQQNATRARNRRAAAPDIQSDSADSAWVAAWRMRRHQLADAIEAVTERLIQEWDEEDMMMPMAVSILLFANDGLTMKEIDRQGKRIQEDIKGAAVLLVLFAEMIRGRICVSVSSEGEVLWRAPPTAAADPSAASAPAAAASAPPARPPRRAAPGRPARA